MKRYQRRKSNKRKSKSLRKNNKRKSRSLQKSKKRKFMGTYNDPSKSKLIKSQRTSDLFKTPIAKLTAAQKQRIFDFNVYNATDKLFSVPGSER